MNPERIVPWVVSMAFFMEALDSTVLNTAIPAMAQSLSVDPVNLKVALISYLLSLAIFIPISGWIADKYGAKPVMTLALSIFTLTSLWCGFAHNMTELVIARFFQGIGGALSLPVGRLLVVRVFGATRLLAVMSHVIMVGAVGLMLGPVLGGLITHYFDWRWIFWVNIPVGLFAVWLACRGLPRIAPQPVLPLDIPGFLLFGIGLGGMTFGLSLLSESSVPWRFVLLVTVVTVLCMALYIVHSRNRENAIVNLRLFHYRTFRVSVFASLFSRLGFGGVPFLLPLLLQIGFGFSPQMAGLLLAPTALGVVCAKPASLWLLRNLGYRRLLLMNTFCAGCMIIMIGRVMPDWPLYLIAALTMVYGFFVSLQYTAINSLPYSEIPSEIVSSATSILSTLQQLAQSFGVGFAALCIRFFAPVETNLQALDPAIFRHTFLIIGAVTVASMVLYLRLQSGDGEKMLSPP